MIERCLNWDTSHLDEDSSACRASIHRHRDFADALTSGACQVSTGLSLAPPPASRSRQPQQSCDIALLYYTWLSMCRTKPDQSRGAGGALLFIEELLVRGYRLGPALQEVSWQTTSVQTQPAAKEVACATPGSRASSSQVLHCASPPAARPPPPAARPPPPAARAGPLSSRTACDGKGSLLCL